MGGTNSLARLLREGNTRRRVSAVDVSVNSTTVFTGKCRIIGVIVNTALSAHALPIKDNTTTLVTLPASAAAGTFFDCFGIPFATSLIVDPDDVATGNITVVYEPLENFAVI